MKQNNKEGIEKETIKRIAKTIDPDNTFLNECEKVVNERFGIYKNNKEIIEKEIKQLMLFCRHNQEAKDRLNKISDLIQSKEKEMLDDEIKFLESLPIQSGKASQYQRNRIKERLQKLKGDEE